MAGQLVSFPQAGQVDWVALANYNVNFSVAVLGRLAKANVDPFTVAVARALFHNSPLAVEGQLRVDEALAQLKAYASYQKVLWFGFGIKHPIHDLAATEQGLTCVAICAALCVSYDSFYAAKVLRELCKGLNASAELSPSIHQWKNLVEVCEGLLITTKLVPLIDGFARILVSPTENGTPQRRPTKPEALAKALLQLFKVVSKTVMTCTFAGGIDCAWLAAVAEWLFGLEVVIQTETSDICYRSSGANDSGRETGLVAILKCNDTGQAVYALSQCYILPDGMDLIKMGTLDFVPSKAQFFLRRSPWTHILSDTFGEKTIACLIQEPVSAYLISIINGLYSRDTIPYPSSRECIWYGHTPSRPLGKVFPELAMLDKAKEAFDQCQSLVGLQNAVSSYCKCGSCSVDQAVEGSALERRPFCLAHLAETIAFIFSNLNVTEYPDGLLPTQEGFLKIHCDCLQLHVERHEVYYETTLQIFLGTKVSTLPWHNSVAVSCGGLCVLKKPLQDPHMPLGQARKTAIIPGHISFNGSQYKFIDDLELLCRDRNEFEPRIGLAPNIDYAELGGISSVDFCVEERQDSQRIVSWYRVRYHSHDSPGSKLTEIRSGINAISAFDIAPITTCQWADRIRHKDIILRTGMKNVDIIRNLVIHDEPIHQYDLHPVFPDMSRSQGRTLKTTHVKAPELTTGFMLIRVLTEQVKQSQTRAIPSDIARRVICLHIIRPPEADDWAGSALLTLLSAKRFERETLLGEPAMIAYDTCPFCITAHALRLWRCLRGIIFWHDGNTGDVRRLDFEVVDPGSSDEVPAADTST